MERKFDPILVEVVKNELAAVTEEMAIAVSKTARSAMVKIGDFAATVCDSQGRLIGPGYAAPFQLARKVPLLENVQLTELSPDSPFLVDLNEQWVYWAHNHVSASCQIRCIYGADRVNAAAQLSR